MTSAVGAGDTGIPSLPFPLQEAEQVLQVCRRHWLYLWPRMVLMVLAAIGPPAVVAGLISEAGAYEGVVARIFWIAAAFYLVYWGIRIFLNWYQYHHDMWVITNQRLIDTRKSNPFNLRLSTADLVNVQDLTVERSGLLKTVFDFGDIICQTAGEQQEFRLKGIPDPRGVQALVDRERDRERLRYRA